MEVIIKDAIFVGAVENGDTYLGLMLSLIIREVRTGRPLFQSPMDEPILYARYIKPWVIEALELKNKLKENKK